MSHFPEKGEAEAAINTLRNRLQASVGGDSAVAVVSVNIDSGETRGDGQPFRGTFGDLFDLAEMTDVSQAPVNNFIFDIAVRGVEPDVAMRSMYLLAVAHGVLMERARWEKRDAS